MSSQYFDKVEALKNQRQLLILKRKRLDELIELINQTLREKVILILKSLI